MGRKWRLSDLATPKTLTGSLRSVIRALKDYSNVTDRGNPFFYPPKAVYTADGTPEMVPHEDICYCRHRSEPVKYMTLPTGARADVNVAGIWLMSRKVWFEILVRSSWMMCRYNDTEVSASTLLVHNYPRVQQRWLKSIIIADGICDFSPLIVNRIDPVEEAERVAYCVHRQIESSLKVDGSLQGSISRFERALEIVENNL